MELITAIHMGYLVAFNTCNLTKCLKYEKLF